MLGSAVDYVNINDNACVTCEPCARDVPPQNVCALTTVSNAGTLPGEHVVFFSNLKILALKRRHRILV